MSGMVPDYMKNVYDYEYEYKVLPYSLRLKFVFAYLNQERITVKDNSCTDRAASK